MILRKTTFSSWLCNQVFLFSSPAFSGAQTPSSVHSLFFFGPTDRPTITRDGAMGNETFYWDGLRLETSYYVTMFVPGLLFINTAAQKYVVWSVDKFSHFSHNLRNCSKMNLFEISRLSFFLHWTSDSFCLVKIGYKSTVSSLPAKHVKTVNSHFVDMKSKLIVKSQILYLGPTLLLFYLYQST